MSRTPGQDGAGGDTGGGGNAKIEAQEKEISELNGTIHMLRSEIKELSSFRLEDDDGEALKAEQDKAKAAESRIEELEQALNEQAGGDGEDVQILQQELDNQRQQNEKLFSDSASAQQRAAEQEQEIEHLSATIQQLQSQLVDSRRQGEEAQQQAGDRKALEEALARARAESEKANALQKQLSRLEADARQRQQRSEVSSPGPPADQNRQLQQQAKENEELKNTLSVVLDQLQQKIDAERAAPEAGEAYHRQQSQLQNELQAALEENKRLMDTNAFMNPNAMKHYKSTISKYEHLRNKTTQDVQKYRQLASKFKDLRQRLAQKDKDLGDVRTQLHTSAAERQDREQELNKLRQDYNALGKQMGKLSAQVARSQPLKSKRVGQLKKLKEDYETLVNQFSTLKKETSQKEAALQTLVGQLTKEKNLDRQKLRDVRRRLREQRGFIVAYLEKQMHMLNNENTMSLDILREFLQNEERAAAAGHRRPSGATPGGPSKSAAEQNNFDELIERSQQADKWFEKGMRATGRPVRSQSGQSLNNLPNSTTPHSTSRPPDGGRAPPRKRFEETTKRSYTYSSTTAGKPAAASSSFLSKPFQSSFAGISSSYSKPLGNASASGLNIPRAGGGGAGLRAPQPVAPSVSESVYSLHAKAQTLNEDMKRKHNDTVSQFKASLEARHRANQQAINRPVGTATVRVY